MVYLDSHEYFFSFFIQNKKISIKADAHKSNDNDNLMSKRK